MIFTRKIVFQKDNFESVNFSNKLQKSHFLPKNIKKEKKKKHFLASLARSRLSWFAINFLWVCLMGILDFVLIKKIMLHSHITVFFKKQVKSVDQYETGAFLWFLKCNFNYIAQPNPKAICDFMQNCAFGPSNRGAKWALNSSVVWGEFTSVTNQC